jgi:hypothetical protein
LKYSISSGKDAQGEEVHKPRMNLIRYHFVDVHERPERVRSIEENRDYVDVKIENQEEYKKKKLFTIQETRKKKSQALHPSQRPIPSVDYRCDDEKILLSWGDSIIA